MVSPYDTYATTIAKANDEFRQAGWGITVTPGVQYMQNVNGLMKLIREYDTFNEDNDPYGEHDFGSLTWLGEKVFWKIDYYNRALSGGVSPLSPQCQRVMTVMRADEY